MPRGVPFGLLAQMTSPPEKVFAVFKKHYREIPLIPVSKTPFQNLVAVMLSARTRDETTAARCKELFKIAPTSGKLAKLTTEQIAKLIYPVGFYKTKAKNLKKLAEDIVGRFGGEVPKTLEGLTSLSGVGRKTANIVLARAFNIPAIGVDTHVHRIANTLGWVRTKTPEQTERELMRVLPKKYWVDVNNLMVSIGQRYRSQRQLEEFLKTEQLVI